MRFAKQFSPDRYRRRWLLMSAVCKHCAQAGCLDIVVKVILLYKEAA